MPKRYEVRKSSDNASWIFTEISYHSGRGDVRRIYYKSWWRGYLHAFKLAYQGHKVEYIDDV